MAIIKPFKGIRPPQDLVEQRLRCAGGSGQGRGARPGRAGRFTSLRRIELRRGPRRSGR